MQGIRYFFSHPDIDGVALRGTLKHLAGSMLEKRRLTCQALIADGIRVVGERANSN